MATITLDAPAAAPPFLRRAVATLAIIGVGFFGGALLGGLARWFMRLVSTEPEFSWGGTLFIVGDFAVFGAAQGAVVAARRFRTRPLIARPVRVVAFVTLVPLCFGPGIVLAPTIIFGGIAIAREDWGWKVRGVCTALAMAPVVLLGVATIRDFGFSAAAITADVLLVVVWGGLAAALWPAFAPWPQRT